MAPIVGVLRSGACRRVSRRDGAVVAGWLRIKSADTMNSRLEPQVSVVIPVYQERESLDLLLQEVNSSLEPSDWSYEVVVVDDGSSDGTAQVLERIAAEHSTIRPVYLERNLGQSGALAIGIQKARGSYLVTLDGDLQNNPADIPRILESLAEADVVSGIRVSRHDDWSRRLASWVANYVRDAILHDGVTDVGCSLKAYRSEFLEGIPVFDGMHRFLPALALANGARIVEIPVDHRARRFGSSKYSISGRLWRGLADLWGVWWLRRRWIGK